MWNPATCNCENGKYLVSIMDDSTFICNQVIDADADAKSNNQGKSSNEANFNKKKSTCKIQNIYDLFAFLLIIVALLIVISICCYLIKYQAKQFLPFCQRNNELREVLS